MATYIALLHKDTGSDFGVTFPDFPGCVSAACDLEGLRRGAAEALALHIDGMIEDGEEIPAATTLAAYTASADTDPALPIMLIAGPAPHSRAVRVNVSLPADLIEAIDRVSPNRSRFLAEAARAKLGQAA
jgi:predicted RNase H-like HicB family nuclease